ncbi:hypothetical protein SUDANB96_03256 [Streptomyces sp. enrichment culture]
MSKAVTLRGLGGFSWVASEFPSKSLLMSLLKSLLVSLLKSLRKAEDFPARKQRGFRGFQGAGRLPKQPLRTLTRPAFSRAVTALLSTESETPQ